LQTLLEIKMTTIYYLLVEYRTRWIEEHYEVIDHASNTLFLNTKDCRNYLINDQCTPDEIEKLISKGKIVITLPNTDHYDPDPCIHYIYEFKRITPNHTEDTEMDNYCGYR
jgi:hypothetical protein